MTWTAVKVYHLKNGSWQRAYQTADPIPTTSNVVNPGGNIQTVLDAAGVGGTVVINDGTYVLTTDLKPYDNQYVYCTDAVFFEGGATLTGWTSDGSGHWYKTGALPASYSDVGVCEVISGTESNQCQQREDLFRDGAPLKRYMVLADLVTGGFFNDYSTGRVYVADDPTGHTMVLSSTQYAVNSTANGVQWRGGTFQHFATPSQKGAFTVNGGDNWIIRKVTCQYNHAIGLRLATSDGTYVTGVKCAHNQQLGMGVYKCANVLVEDSEFGYNNDLRLYYQSDWECGGFKATYSSNCKIRRCYSHHNRGVGLWFDIDNFNWTVGGAWGDGNRCEYNFSDGIRYEISFTADISYNSVSWCGHGQAYDGQRNSDFSVYATAGINVNCSPDVHIHHNTVTNNENGVALQQRTRTPQTSPTFGWSYDTHGCEVDHNTITQQVYGYTDINGVTHAAGTERGLGEGVSGIGVLSPFAPSQYGAVANNRWHDNVYVLGDLVNGTAQSTKQRWIGYNGSAQAYMTFGNWKALALMDTSGSMTSTTG